MRQIYLLIFLALSPFLYAQKLKKDEKVLMANLQQHVRFLASDQMQGRMTGEPGEIMAAEYLASTFRSLGLQPKGTEGFFQPFRIPEGWIINPSTHLIINGNHLALEKDYFPLGFTGDSSFEAMPSIALQESGMPWFLDLKEILEESSSNPHFDLNSELIKAARDMETKGASALFVYNSSAIADRLVFSGSGNGRLNIPVLYIKQEAAKKYFSDITSSLDIKIKTELSRQMRDARNVVGYLDNGAPTTIVLGAHFDHLGTVSEGGKQNNAAKVVFNGADDNASGVAGLIEMARLLRGKSFRNNNYAFIGFSGEELGLLGSKYFVENPTIDLSSVNFMVNMDMIGRLNDTTSVLTVGGYGTARLWGDLYSLSGKKGLYSSGLAFRFDSSGVGPSDHTSFYRKTIPVLFYFTGIHQDYHKPGDDYDKLNYTGQMRIVKHILSLIEKANSSARAQFLKTREPAMNTNTRFSVTLGIMPDYSYSGQGLRIDDISENKAAQKAGMMEGDIIISLGNNKVSSITDYMEALGKFKKGDTTLVQFNRGGKTLSAEVTF